MKESLVTMKGELKVIGKGLKELKKQRNLLMKNNDFSVWKVQSKIIDEKYKFRHMHTAYCLALGTNYSQIENKCRRDNAILKSEVKNYLEKYELEAVGDLNG